MANTDRVIKITFVGDSSGVESSIDAVKNHLSGMGVTVQTTMSRFVKGTGEARTTVRLLAQDATSAAAAVKKLGDALQNSGGAGLPGLRTGFVSGNASQIAAQASDAARQAADAQIIAAKRAQEQIQRFRENTARNMERMEIRFAEQTGQKVQAIKLKQLADERAARQKYANDIAAIEARIKAGNLTPTQAMPIQVGALVRLERELLQVKANADAARQALDDAARAARNVPPTRVQQFIQDNAARQAQLARNAEMQVRQIRTQARNQTEQILADIELQSARRTGDKTTVARLEAGRRELAARRQLAAEMARIENSAGQMTSVARQTAANAALGQFRQQMSQIRRELDSQLQQIQRENAQQQRLASQRIERPRDILQLLNQHGEWLKRLIQIDLAYRGINAVINSVLQAFKEIPAAGMQYQNRLASLSAIFGTETATKNLREIDALATKWGQDLTVVEQGYEKIAPAATLAGMSQSELNQLFEDMVVTNTVLHRSNEQVQRGLYSIEQMLSKGYVMSEELFQQFAEAYPAVAAFAAKADKQAEGSVQKLRDRMKRGLVESKGFVMEMFRLYREAFAGVDDRNAIAATQTLQAKLNMLKNAYTELNRIMFESTGGPMTAMVSGLTSALQFLGDNFTAIGTTVSIVAGIMITRWTAMSAIWLARNTALIASNIRLAASTLLFQRGLSSSQITVLGGQMASVWQKIGAYIQVATGWLLKFVGITPAVAGWTALAGAVAATTASLAGFSATYDEIDGVMIRFEGDFEARQASLSNIMEVYWGRIKDTASSIWDSIANYVKGQVSAISSWLSGIGPAVSGSLKNAGAAVADFFGYVAKQVAGFVSTIYSNIRGAMGAIREFGANVSSISFWMDQQSSSLASRVKGAFWAGKDQGQKDFNQGVADVKADISATIDKNIASFEDKFTQALGVNPAKAMDNVMKTVKEGTGKAKKEWMNILGEAAELDKFDKDQKMKKMLGGLDLSKWGAAPATPKMAGGGGGSGRKGRKSGGGGGGMPAEFADWKDEAKTRVDTIKDLLDKEEKAFKNHEVSIATHFQRKEDLQREMLQAQLNAAQKSLDLAKKAAPKKVNMYQRDVDTLREQIANLPQDILTEKTRELEEWNNKLLEVQSAFYSAVGDSARAISLQRDADRKKKMSEFSIEMADNPAAKTAMQQYDAKTNIDIYSAKVADLREKMQQLQDQYGNTEKSLQVEQEMGVRGELDGLYNLQNARERYTEGMQKMIDKWKEYIAILKNTKVDGMPIDISKFEQELANASTELKTFSDRNGLLVERFENMFVNAMDSAGLSLMQFMAGTKTAESAMKQFLNNLLKEISDTLGHELSVNFKNLGKMIWAELTKSLQDAKGASGGSGIFGSIFSGVGNIAGDFWKAIVGSSKGNVFQNGNVIPFARGGIPDLGDKLAYFPMAKGGIGSLRENGPEAIMPLKRDSAGNLGVKAEGVNAGNVINITVNVDGKNKSDHALAVKIAQEISRNVAKQEIVNSVRPGNVLNRGTKIG